MGILWRQALAVLALALLAVAADPIIAVAQDAGPGRAGSGRTDDAVKALADEVGRLRADIATLTRERETQAAQIAALQEAVRALRTELGTLKAAQLPVCGPACIGGTQIDALELRVNGASLRLSRKSLIVEADKILLDAKEAVYRALSTLRLDAPAIRLDGEVNAKDSRDIVLKGGKLREN